MAHQNKPYLHLILLIVSCEIQPSNVSTNSILQSILSNLSIIMITKEIKGVWENMLYLIGLGLGGPNDITLRGLEAMSKCETLILESYTSLYTACISKDKIISQEDYDQLQQQYMKELGYLISSWKDINSPKILIADRYCIEQAFYHPSHQNNVIHEGALNLNAAEVHKQNIGILIVGDPLSATTHIDLVLKCKSHNIPYEIIHNASIMTAVGKTGLFLYHFGPSVSIPFFTQNWKPSSFYSKIVENKQRNLHTLCLLDIKVGEPTDNELARWKPGQPYKSFQPPKFMAISMAIEQLFFIEKEMKQGIATSDTLAIGIARLGSPSEIIKTGTLSYLLEYDFGSPLHSLVLPASIDSLHESEKKMISLYK